MDKRVTDLTTKRAAIADMIAAVDRKERIVTRTGGASIVTFAEERAFQQARLEFCDWLIGAEVDAITAAIAEEQNILGPEWAAMIGSDLRGLPIDVVLTVARLELGLLALGQHPAQIRRDAQLAATAAAAAPPADEAQS